MRVVAPFELSAYASRGAVGLLVPGDGQTVTRAGALASLERGKVQHALLGGVPTGKVLFVPSSEAGSRVTIYVSLPPAGTTPNDRRYPIAVVGCGLHGLLTSSNTRVTGLISIADVAPAVVHLRAGGCRSSPLASQASSDAAAKLSELDHRIHRVAKARGWAAVALLFVVGLVALVNGRAGVIACVAAVAGSLVLSALGIENFWALILGVVGFAVVLSLIVPWPRSAITPLVSAFFLALLLVFLFDTELNSVAVLGARPDGGGRFYGLTNQLETLLLAPALAAVSAATLPWSALVAALVLVTVGWSHAGADGGGIVVYLVAFTVLALRKSDAPLTARRVVLAAAAVVVLTFAIVGADAALGGSSHVTHAVGGGPGTLFGDLGHRLHLSYLTVTSTAGKIAEFAVSITALVVIAVFLRDGPTVDAMLVAVAVSFLVNDSPVDVAFLGAIGCWALVRWEAVDSRAMRRPAAAMVPFLLVMLAAGCGSKGTVQPLPETVIGTVAAPSPAAAGKALFASQGCNGCHTFTAAGATGTIGPDLDKLPLYAKRAHQPLQAFVKESIVDPNAYIEKGYPKNVMPQTFKSLPADQINALVAFLTQPSSG
ncbi:MAG TPA: cytochrome c [Gaiellaceae bacterium]|nr:cytochrome c [Gaiellaceae bacterium]